VYLSNGVAELVTKHHCDVETMRLELKGIDEPVKVYKISGGN